MLDTFIIERIRREREREREQAYQPLRIERRPPPVEGDVARPREEEKEKRGSVVIDFRL